MKHEALHALHVRQAKPPPQYSAFLSARSSKSGRVQPTMEPLPPTKAVQKGGGSGRRLLPAFSVFLPVRSSMKRGSCVLQLPDSYALRPSTKMMVVTVEASRAVCRHDNSEAVTLSDKHSPGGYGIHLQVLMMSAELE